MAESFQLLPLLISLYGFLSLLTFVLYAVDKQAARRGRWRIRESTLHLLALCGGWPGALLAQRWIRHKSRKAAFQLRFWLTVLLNCAALAGGAWLASSGELMAWL